MKSKLTEREIAVAELLCKGLSNEEIAKALNVTDHTAKAHLQNIFRKYGVNKRTKFMFLYKSEEMQNDFPPAA